MSKRRPRVSTSFGVLRPLRAEGAHQPQHLVGRLLDHDRVERLADDTEHREQGERRAEDDLLAEGVVDDRGVGLEDEPGDRLVGHEEQELIARQASAVEVVALREVAHLHLHVAHELLTLTAALLVGGRIEVAQVRGERELHVHVQHVVFRELEREVGDRPAALDRGLLLVVDVLDEAGEPQHVFGHALAPLAPRLAAGERLAQAVGGVGERARGGRVELELLAQPPERHRVRPAEIAEL